MNEDEPPFERIALADPLGRGIGFLVPVFRHGRSNSLFVQHIQDGRIADFEAIDIAETKLHPAELLATARGGAECWAFAFAADDVVAGQGEDGREILRKRLDDPALIESPALGFELAEFLDQPFKRLSFARLVRDELAVASSRAASRWCDLSILTPDLRRRLRAGNRDAMVAGADRLVVTTDWKSVVVYGAPASVGGDRELIVQTVYELMGDLVSLYGSPAPGWKVEFRSTETRRSGQPSAELIAMSGSYEVQNLLLDLRRDGLLSVNGFDDQHPTDFLSACAALEQPGFVFYTPSNQSSVSDLAQRRVSEVVAIELQPQLTGTSAQRRLEIDATTIPVVVVQTGVSLPRHANQSPALRPLQLGLAGIATVLKEGGVSQLASRSFLLHGRGQGPEPEIDAWIALYDRAWALGLDPHKGLCIDPYLPPDSEYVTPAHRINGLVPLETARRGDLAKRVLSATRSHAMLLVPQGEPDARNFEARKRGLIQVLDNQGWSVEETSRGGSELMVSGKRSRFFVSSRPVSIGETDAVAGHRPGPPLNEIERLVVTSNATPGNVLSRLALSGDLELNMRDLLHLPVERSTVFTLLGAQVARMMTGFRSRTRSNFLALLIREAIAHGKVDITDAGGIQEAGQGLSLGETAMIVLRRVQRVREAVMADVQITATAKNDFAEAGTVLVEPFSIRIDHDCVALVPTSFGSNL